MTTPIGEIFTTWPGLYCDRAKSTLLPTTAAAPLCVGRALAGISQKLHNFTVTKNTTTTPGNTFGETSNLENTVRL